MKFIIAVLIALATICVQGQDVAQQIDEYIQSYANTGDFSGCILITKEGKKIYDNCIGNANYSFDIPNQPHTKFKIGSISKQFTAVAILLLEQDGSLNTSDSLSRFFPNSPLAERLNIEQLLTHTSGISDIYTIPDFYKLSSQHISISDLSEMILAAELEFEPGSQYQYSNGGYALLAAIIEKVSGISYQEYVTEKIFYPLKMNATGHAKGNEVIPNLAVGYDPLGYQNVKITDYLDPELLKGSGSLYSTVSDLQTWIQSIKNRTLMTEDSYDKLLKDYGHRYGYGISVYSSFDQAVFGHDGRINGYIADYLHYQESDVSIIVLGNIQTGVVDFFRRDIAAILFSKDYASRAKTILPSTGHNIETEKILGTYAFGPNFKVYVEMLRGTIQARANQGGYSELVLLEDGRFFSRTLYAYIEFKANEEGEITKMIWTNNDGNSFEGIKSILPEHGAD